MGISPIGTGISTGVAFGMSSGGGKADIQNKISTLEKQKAAFEKEKQDNKMSSSDDVDKKIESLDKRIQNLQNRLDKIKGRDRDDDGKCDTCENRRYQDGSDDPGVSFKSATKLSPEEAASAVRGHEMEHVYRNQAKAAREDKRIVSQTVTIKTDICPECGKPYTAGGVTKTVTKPKQDLAAKFNAGREDKQKGSLFSSVA